MARDSQKAKVYQLERVFGIWSGPRIELEEARTFINKAWRKHSPKGEIDVPPFLQDGRAMQGGGHADPYQMNIAKQSRTLFIVVHELTHSIVQRAVLTWGVVIDEEGYRHNTVPWEERLKVVGHGPEFVRLLIEMAARYCGIDRDELIAAAKERRIKIGTNIRMKELGIRMGGRW